jgi:hypothetical protein
LAFLWHFEGLAILRDSDTLRSLYLGLKFDARLAAIMVLPVWLLLRSGQDGEEAAWRRWSAPASLALSLVLYVILILVAMVDDRAARPWLLAFLVSIPLHRRLFPRYGMDRNPSARWIWGAFAVLVLGSVLLGYFVDFGSYSYIHTRLNGTLLMFAENADISLQMVWESYPVIRCALALALLLSVAIWGLNKLARGLRPSSLAPWKRRTAAILGTLALLFVIYGKWSRYPLR